MKPLELSHISMSGTSLIEASAGTGKTWTIAALYMRLLLERAMKPDEILVVTYTKAATAELKERIRERISSSLEMFSGKREPLDGLDRFLMNSCHDKDKARKILTRALYSFDDAAIFTIHGFCQRALSDNAFESGSLFDTDLLTDQSSILNETADDFWRTVVMKEPDDFISDLISHKQTPQTLLATFQGHYQSPSLKIIPDPDPFDYGRAYELRNQLFGQAAALWQLSRDRIVPLLHKPGLSQASYKPQQIAKAADMLDEWFQGHPSPLCEKLSLFCSENLLKKTTKGNTPPQDHFFHVCQQLLDACLEAESTFEQKLIQLRTGLYQWLAAKLPERKHRENLRCYDDLLLDLAAALEGEAGNDLADRLRDKYRASLIDEFQDTDQLQWSIFKQLASPPDYPLFIIGDPKQAIYSFRGADICAYLIASSTVEDGMRWTLDTNRRSTRLLVEAVNAVFDNCSDPFLSSGIRFQSVIAGRNGNDSLLKDNLETVSPLRFWIYPSDEGKPQNKSAVRQPIAAAVAGEILKLLEGPYLIRQDQTDRKAGPGDMAVLVRTHNQAEMIQSALSACGIPSVQHGNMTIFETAEALDLLRILRAAAGPGRESLVKEAMLGGLLGINANGLEEILHDDLQWDMWLGRFREMGTVFRSGGMIAMSTTLLEECGVRQNLLSLPDGERRLTNLLHCVELVHHASLELAGSINGCTEWLEKRISGLQQDETALLRLETDEQAVRISTIHASKGLQYPIVFLPFAWDVPAAQPDQAVFHDQNGNLVMDLGSSDYDQHMEMTRSEQEAEAIRLLYVAMTRAEFRCYIVWGAIRQAESSPLFRLLHGRSGKAFKDYGDSAIMADMAGLSLAAPGISAGLISLSPDMHEYSGRSDLATPLCCPDYHTPIPNDWRISSFSSISGGVEKLLQPRDLDGVTADSSGNVPARQLRSETISIFDFPRGAEAGTCLHELFEHLDFASATEQTIASQTQRCLQRNGYDLCWQPAVSDMVGKALKVSLLPHDPSFSLSGLKPGSWLTEMEFFLPLDRVDAKRLKGIFSGQICPDRHGNFEELLAALHIQETRGLLIGFMDMVFEHGGRYYIIDWKSNHLGYDKQSYGRQQLRASMSEHAYILQYHLYTLALDRLLAQRVPGYDYQTHFGGAIYLFLRGLDLSDPDLGIFMDRPTAEFIQKSNHLLLAHGESA